MRTIVWFIWFWVQLAVLQPLQRRGKKALQAGDDAAVDALVEKMVPKWAGGLLRLAGVTVEVKSEWIVGWEIVDYEWVEPVYETVTTVDYEYCEVCGVHK